MDNEKLAKEKIEQAAKAKIAGEAKKKGFSWKWILIASVVIIVLLILWRYQII